MTKTTLQPSDYVHLHNHTHYSLLDGLQNIPEMVDQVKELGMEAIAVTDHGTMSGAIEFYKACEKEGIKPIIGFETYVAKLKHTDKRPRLDDRPATLLLLPPAIRMPTPIGTGTRGSTSELSAKLLKLFE